MNQHIGKSRGGNTTELHTFVDGLGNLVYIVDIPGDKAYGTKEFRTYITSQEAIYTIPPKSNNKEPWDFDW